jgi:hypothetical protein
MLTLEIRSITDETGGCLCLFRLQGEAGQFHQNSIYEYRLQCKSSLSP